MGYRKQDFIRIRNEYSQKYRRAREAAEERCEQLYEKVPGLQTLDRMLARTSAQLIEVAIRRDSNVEEQIAAIRAQNEKLQAERAALLTAYGYPADYTDVHYDCPLCGDTGYVETKMCECMKRALILAAYESSGIGALMQTQSFETFSLDYYRERNDQYEHMSKILEATKKFATEFSDASYRNLLFMGGTGLGKTHLSSAIAKTVIDRGFDVLYVPASGMMSDFEERRFGNSATDGSTKETERYYTADLLIIDDLGTEMTNQFTLTCLYDVINSRIIRRKSTVISTNLNKEEIRKRYWDRITSRIFGEYLPLPFVGTDIREQKIFKR